MTIFSSQVKYCQHRICERAAAERRFRAARARPRAAWVRWGAAALGARAAPALAPAMPPRAVPCPLCGKVRSPAVAGERSTRQEGRVLACPGPLFPLSALCG